MSEGSRSVEHQVLVGPTTSSGSLTADGNPRRDLCGKGFAYLKGKKFQIPPRLREDLRAVTAAFDHLPVDSYSASACRFRAHQRLVLTPSPLVLIPTAVCSYKQTLQLNSQDGGTVREFEPLPGELASNAFLRSLILYDFESSPFSSFEGSNVVFDVGVHLIRMYARPGQPAVASPNILHKDGEWVTWIHLMDRQCVSGGESLVADNDRQELIRVLLAERLDTVAVWDDAVYHHVNPLEVVAGEARGYRDVLLIDFTPMLPVTIFEGRDTQAVSDLLARSAHSS